MLNRLSQLPRGIKLLIMITVDGLALPFAFWSACALRYGELWPPVEKFWWLLLAAPAICIPLFAWFGLYRMVTRYLSRSVITPIVQGVTVSVLGLIAFVLMLQLEGVPRSAFLIYWGVAILYIVATRFTARGLLQRGSRRRRRRRPVGIYGAGEAGRQLATALESGSEMQPAFYIDDDDSLHGLNVQGIRVYPPEDLGRLIERYQIRSLLLAMPSINRTRRRQILRGLENYALQIMVVPSVNELASGRARVDELRVVNIEDLLGRDPVTPDTELIERSIRGRVVMVTGAGGSIGSELCRQIARSKPHRLVLFEQSEYGLYRIERELEQMRPRHWPELGIIPVLGNVQAHERIVRVMEEHEVDTVFHAAAYKHVPLVEHNPVEGVRNNVIGTWHTLQAALEAKVDRFVLVSTDKAVRPTNVMGASKRLAELIVQAAANEYPDCRFCMVRFGNVLGSSGSVVPLFQEQIERGGPVTVTDPEMLRYFMTISEAAQLVIQAGAMGDRGEVFLLDMAEPVKIRGLAERMIHLSGLTVRSADNPEGDIEIVHTGIRPGEKLYEELLVDENAEPTPHPRIHRARETFLDWQTLRQILERLEQALASDDIEALKSILEETVAGYQPAGHAKRDVADIPQSG